MCDEMSVKKRLKKKRRTSKKQINVSLDHREEDNESAQEEGRNKSNGKKRSNPIQHKMPTVSFE
jgi:hypothetical protein